MPKRRSLSICLIITDGKSLSLIAAWHCPVIVRDYKGDWSIFSSKRLEGGNSYDGFFVAKEGDYKGKIVGINASGEEYRPFDISITKNVMALLITALVMCLLFFPGSLV